ncbi:MAG: Na/Pi cotransporter family protein [Clostridiales bacterium]|nr:Na/Pi cotransporter family protein [Clostridiales bacterium]
MEVNNLMDFSMIISLLGGVACFLFGMSVMGDSLKKVAGSKMEMILFKLAGNPVKGILLGTVVTAVIQSSSATSVMVVGFVNSGMMKVRQAIGVILGAILGTSITGWILALNSVGGSDVASFFSTEILTGIVALIGIILWMFSKNATHKNIGGIMMGFAVLMYGMSMMSGAIEPLRDDPRFIHLLTSFKNPLLGVLAGALITAVIQSASAAVGILQALAMTGAVEFDMAFPILMGIGIGASVPVMLSALGASTNGKRTAFVYLVIDVIGAALCGLIFYSANAVIGFSFMNTTMTMVSIALTNSLYRLAIVILLAPGIGILERMVCALFPEGEEAAAEQADMDRLETRFLEHPTLALAQSREVIASMAEKAFASVKDAVTARRDLDNTALKRVFELEGVVDRYEDKLGSYLFKITSADLQAEQAREVNKYLRVLSDFERISDHARNIGEAVQEIKAKKVVFSDKAEQELRVLEDSVQEITENTIEAFVKDDKSLAMKIDPLEEVIDDLCDEIKSNHIDRVGRQECTLELGFVFNDLLTDYERIADHCSNVAVDILESGPDGVEAHEYHINHDYRNDESFINYFNEYKAKYVL